MIRQLTLDEARLVAAFKRFPLLPTLDCYSVDPTGMRYDYARSVSEIYHETNLQFPDRWPIYSVNLARLGITEVINNPGPYTEPDYQRIIALPWLQKMRQGLDDLERERGRSVLTFNYIRHQLVVTEFGRRFINAVTEPD
jgi:hypothetical protein